MPKTSASLKRCQPPRNSLISVGREDVGPGSGDVLRAAEVVALVVAPERGAGFVGVVEQIAAGELVFARQGVIDAGGEVLAGGDGAERRGHES